MTERIHTSYRLDTYIREREDITLVSSGGNSSKTLHIKRDSCEEPLCRARLRQVNRWMAKSLTVYPPCFHPFCPECAEKRYDIEVNTYD